MADVITMTPEDLASAIAKGIEAYKASQPKPGKKPTNIVKYRVIKTRTGEAKLVSLNSVENTLRNMFAGDQKKIDKALATLEKDGTYTGSYKSFEKVIRKADGTVVPYTNELWKSLNPDDTKKAK